MSRPAAPHSAGDGAARAAAVPAASATALPSVGIKALLAGLICLSAIAIDITLVALPQTAAALGGDPLRSGLIVTAYLAGFAPGQLLWGLLADRYGRRPPVVASLVAFVLATAACALAGSFGALLAARFVQGLAGGAGPVLSRTIVRDFATDAAGARLLALLTAVLGAAPLLAPLLGALLLELMSWRSIFWITAVYGVVLFVIALARLPESLPARTADAPAALSLAERTARLARSREFRLGAALVALPFAGYHTLLALYPAVAILEHRLGEAQFAALFAATAACFVAGSTVSRLLVLRAGVPRLMLVAALLCLAGAALALLGRGGAHGLTWLGFGAGLYVLGVGQMLPLATTLALRGAHGMAGWAAALLGLVQIGGGALVSYGAAATAAPGRALTAVLLVCALATLLAVIGGWPRSAPQPASTA